MEKSLTGIKDVDLKILSELNDRDLLNFCSSHKYGKALYDNEEFWRNRLEKFFPDAFDFKSPKRSWKNYYLQILYYLDEKRKDENFALYNPAKKGDRDIIDYLLFLGARNFHLGLAGAAKGGYRDLVDFFIYKLKEKGKEERVINHSIYIALSKAIIKNHMDLVLYLEKMIPLTLENINFNLIEAGMSGSLDMVKHIIDLGANNWQYGKWGAKERGHTHLVEFFDNLMNK